MQIAHLLDLHAVIRNRKSTGPYYHLVHSHFLTDFRLELPLSDKKKQPYNRKSPYTHSMPANVASSGGWV